MKQLLVAMSAEPGTAAAAAGHADLKRLLRRSGVSSPPPEARLRRLALAASSTHLDSARDCADPALALAAVALAVCPERARDEAVKGRELLLKAVSILTNFNDHNVVPKTLAQLKAPSELVSFAERLLRAGAKRKVSIVVVGKAAAAAAVGEKERRLVMEFARAMVAANEIDQAAEGLVLDAMALYALKGRLTTIKQIDYSFQD